MLLHVAVYEALVGAWGLKIPSSFVINWYSAMDQSLFFILAPVHIVPSWTFLKINIREGEWGVGIVKYSVIILLHCWIHLVLHVGVF
jgi:hypothetical protein